jgi:uncharacterized protein (TIGR03546 family)
MVNLFLRPVRLFAQVLAGNETPRQLAWGFALGMMVGLLPKGTLLAMGLAMLLCALRVNKAAGLLSVGLFSYLGACLDPFAHHLGAIALTWPPAHNTFAWLYNQPLGPLAGYNNTVVMGQLLIGLYLLYPTYLLARVIATSVQPRIHGWLMRRKATRWLRGAEVGAQWGLE